MSARHPEFRLGTVLATSFTATLTERQGAPVERIPTADRLLDWLAANDLFVEYCSEAEIGRARVLREAIHASVTAAALEDPLPAPAVDVINDASTTGLAAAVLTAEGNRRWQLGPTPSIQDALSVIAADAVAILSGERDGRLSLCASPTCRAAFFDTSRSRTRRWCDMNTCGNRQKKQRFHATHRATAAIAE